MTEVKVSKTSNAKSLAGSIAKILREEETVTARAVGPFAVNQLVKGIAIARGYVIQNGYELTCYPTFTDVLINGMQNTAVTMIIKREAK